MIGRLALLVCALLFGLAALELGLRIARGPEWLVKAPNILLFERAESRVGGEGRVIPDARLGFVTRPGFSSQREHHDAHGFRQTPASPSASLGEPPILVVGDSFAYGDEIDDADTWPALLQPLIGRRVINAAVPGYGLDQTLLRAESTVVQVKPAALVLSFISDDVRRMEMKRVWGVEKPYLVLEGGALHERNIPVPVSPMPADTLDVWQRSLGWSLLVETTMKRLGLWYEWMIDYARILPAHQGEAMVCPLFQRLATLNLPTLVVAEYDPFVWRDPSGVAENRRLSRVVLKCAADVGFATLDLFDTIDAGVKQMGVQAMFRLAHPLPPATRLAARRIADELAQRHIPP